MWESIGIFGGCGVMLVISLLSQQTLFNKHA